MVITTMATKWDDFTIIAAHLADEAHEGFEVQGQRREAELIDLVPVVENFGDIFWVVKIILSPYY